MAKKNNTKIILIVLAIALLLYFWNKSKTKTTDNQCTNSCCSKHGDIVMPSDYPDCKCPTSDYVFDGEKCVMGKTGVNGCMDVAAINYDVNASIQCVSCCNYGVSGCTDPLATNYNPSATINNGSCDYGQSTHVCFSNCDAAGNVNAISTNETCGTGTAISYPHTTAPNCTQTQSHFCYTNCGGATGTYYSSMATTLPCGSGLTANYPNSSAPNCSNNQS